MDNSQLSELLLYLLINFNNRINMLEGPLADATHKAEALQLLNKIKELFEIYD